MELRDKNIIDFINLVELCKSEHVKKLFFEDVHKNVCMRRLKKISEDEYVNRYKYDANTFVYYSEKKPAKRIINHDLYITEFVVEMIKQNYEIIDFRKSFCIGNIISDAYIKYKGNDGRIKHCMLEVQLSNKVEDCVNKYKKFKNMILENNLEWKTIPKIIVVTDMKQRVELKGYNIFYINTNLNNISEVLN